MTASLVLVDMEDGPERIYRALTGRCGFSPKPEDGCYARHMVGMREQVAVLYSKPDLSSPAVARVLAVPVVRPGEFESLAFAFDVERMGRPGVFQRWIDDIGDWGYGIHVDGNVRRVGKWAQLVGPTAVEGSWLPIESARMTVMVDGIEGHILELESLPSAVPGFASVPEGSYFIVRVDSEIVELRPEVASDMACGREVPPPSVRPAVLRASAAQFFGPDGRPRFRTKYTKGC